MGFAIGLILLTPIFYLGILAFGDATYRGPAGSARSGRGHAACDASGTCLVSGRST